MREVSCMTRFCRSQFCRSSPATCSFSSLTSLMRRLRDNSALSRFRILRCISFEFAESTSLCAIHSEAFLCRPRRALELGDCPPDLLARFAALRPRICFRRSTLSWRLSFGVTAWTDMEKCHRQICTSRIRSSWGRVRAEGNCDASG